MQVRARGHVVLGGVLGAGDLAQVGVPLREGRFPQPGELEDGAELPVRAGVLAPSLLRLEAGAVLACGPVVADRLPARLWLLSRWHALLLAFLLVSTRAVVEGSVPGVLRIQRSVGGGGELGLHLDKAEYVLLGEHPSRLGKDGIDVLDCCPRVQHPEQPIIAGVYPADVVAAPVHDELLDHVRYLGCVQDHQCTISI